MADSESKYNNFYLKTISTNSKIVGQFQNVFYKPSKELYSANHDEIQKKITVGEFLYYSHKKEVRRFNYAFRK